MGPIAFIGAGNMARALIEGLVQSGKAAPTQVVAHDIRAEVLESLASQYGIRTAAALQDAVQNAQLVVLSVKPQTLPSLLPNLGPLLAPEALVVSVAAGVPTAVIEAQLPAGTRVIRAMPNTPALVKAGATGLAQGRAASAEDLQKAQQLFDSVGITVSLADEGQLDAVTGVSGSGPAYVFRFAEALTEAARQVGLDPTQAHTLAIQTLFGAATLLKESGEAPATLRENVTSKGGTTAAGLAILEETGFAEAVAACVRAATQRSRQLGDDARAHLAEAPAPGGTSNDG